MKKRRKFYHPDPCPQDPEGGQTPEFQGTLMEVFLILLIGIIAVMYLVYKYYVQTPPKPASPRPVEIPQEGSTRHADLPEGQNAPVDPQITPPVNAQIVDPANAPNAAPTQEVSTETQEAIEAFKTSGEWWQKRTELSKQYSQANWDMAEVMPKSDEDLKRFQADPERQRRFSEAVHRAAKLSALMKAHYKEDPLLPFRR